MGFELHVTEVGPAEYPLLEVLRESIFSEYGHRSLTSIADDLDGRHDVLALIAHLEGNPVGFKVGYRDRPGVFYSKSGGVLKDYRRLGLGRRMQEWQQSFCRARRYRQVYFNTFNHFKEMILFGLKSGFRPIGAERQELGAMSFKFALDLTAPPPAGDPDESTAGPEDGRREIDHRNAAAMARAISDGFEMTGIRHDRASGRTRILVERQ